ncbi:MAG: valine--tRNA ligase [Candidatus Bathyarchaeota archaeon]|nr:valine--tRNA ligase [Candidatus Bathyarchaeota archaeon]UCE57471.1 MAG: valine--tRNA ligase [Candidatus Bathyarchaeota archaeon]
MKKLPKECNILQIEEKWQRKWEEMGVYRFDWKDQTRPVYTIDTPPPYPSGNFHMGNVLNWTYFDVVARYKRMRGHNVLFPQGWDCHGLPTEVETEEEYGIKKTDMPPAEFIKLCKKFVNKYIGIMKKAVKRLGCSIDWTTEYKTMDPDYWRRTQLSFILLHKKGMIYQGTHPINWCPSCETAIADAEVEHETREGTLHYIEFKLEDDESLTIATTRPELLPACVTVAVHPNDRRYHEHIDKRIAVPVANRIVKIIQDPLVDPKFGTGVVMICTYGDKADVKAVAKHHLPAIITIDEEGKMNKNAGRYAGLAIQEAKEAVVSDLREKGLVEKTEKLQQEVGVCWRCKTPIEILERKQWFMKTRVLTDAVKQNTLEITWYPDYMKNRMIDWAQSLDWDWVISRQRIFATPIPIWYCKKCGEMVLAKLEWVPIDPRIENPKIDKCPKCGSNNFTPETDVLDTWFDSSITCAVHAGWPDSQDWRRLYPADLHTSGYDIIRTWAYYLMVRHLALFDEKPYKSVLINGMVLGSDGRKMSKSLGNYVATPDAFNKYGADAPRQWAASGGATGSDIPYRWADVEYGWRFLIKLWNAARFASLHLQDYTPQEEPELNLLDQWLLTRMEKVTQRATIAMENCQFNLATEEIRNFAWHELCDQYIEAIKHRLYKAETYGEKKKKAAQYTLYNAIYRTLQLLAPISPHITEEIYQFMYANKMKNKSIHLSPWPSRGKEKIDQEIEKDGNLIMTVIGEIRRDKAERKKPLNASIKKLTIHSGSKKNAQILSQALEDIAGTCKTERIEIEPVSRKGKEVQGYPEVQFSVDY